MNTTIRIYGGDRDTEIADFILSIQNEEAGLNLSIEDQPDLLDIADTYRAGGFWIAADDRGNIVGTIGLLRYADVGVLKKFFVAASFRGRGGPAFGLLDHLLGRAGELQMTDIFLDTPAVATRSHAFYARNGFKPARKDKLPVDYVYSDRDSLLFRRQLEAR